MDSTFFGPWLAFVLSGFIFIVACVYMLLVSGGLAERIEELLDLLDELDARVERLERVLEDVRERKALK